MRATFPGMDWRLIDNVLVEGRVVLTSVGDRGAVGGLFEKARIVKEELVFEDLMFEDGYGGNRMLVDVDLEARRVLVAERTVQI
jgi:hypothetical protein